MGKSLKELIYENGIVFITTLDNSEQASDIIFKLMEISQQTPEKEIRLYISSRGGSYLDMMAIYDTIKAIKNPISGYCIGNAHQFAALLLAACNKGHRFILEHSEVFITQPHGFLGSGGNQETEIVIAANEATQERKVFEEALALETGKTIEEIHNDCENGLTLHGREAIAYGIVDHVLEK